ncbi:MAG: Lrp/AsnC family transcriptional regulator [Betaproteobacteria bacterium]|jgi:siroheme decarboxylase|nr:MAG: Lrp/AsnC family transcriptional regulator [Betaproteobacteria bacterium]
MSIVALSALDKRIINQLHGGFPLCPAPYRVAAEALGTDETTLLERLTALLAEGTLTRFGPLFNADHMGGANVLAAMAVPMARFDAVAAQVNAHAEIAHNYQRDHALNMWFVAAAATPEAVEACFCRIEAETDLAVARFPKEREFFVELKLSA